MSKPTNTIPSVTATATKPSVYYAKLHTALFIPGVTSQTKTTLDLKEPGTLVRTMSVEGDFLAVNYNGTTVLTPISNVICLAQK